ncbi:MAG: TonB-dependent receptor [Bacteroidota bacterium]
MHTLLLAACWATVASGFGPPPGEEAPDTVYQMPPVVVTGTEAVSRRTPVTFSNLTSRDLAERYSVQDIPVLLAELPSITTYSENGSGIGYTYLNMRGFDQRRISVMINGVPQNDPEDHNVYWLDVPDLAASTGLIQVQRGAGRSFYGPPAIGGSVNLVTNPFLPEPALTFEAMAGFQEFGEEGGGPVLNTRKYSATFNSGLVGGEYMFYGRLARILTDGYRDNSFVDLGSYFFGALRSGPGFTARFHLFGGPVADGLAYYGLPRFVKEDLRLRRENLAAWEADSAGSGYLWRQGRRPQETESFSQPHYEAILEWKATENLTLHGTFFHYAGEGHFDYDASWADTAMLRIGSAFGIPASQNPSAAIVRAFVGNRQWGWLPRAEVAHAGGELVVGAELRHHRSTHWGKIRHAGGLPAGLDPDYTFYEYNGIRDIVSLYGHELYRLSESAGLMADLQLVYNRYGIRNEKFLARSFDVRYLFLNPRLGLHLNLDDTWSAYAALAHTTREPRMRNLYAAEDSWFGATPQFRADTSGGEVRYDFSRPLARPEKLLNLELGSRYEAGPARLCLTLFWMEFTDELVKSGQVDVFGQPVTGNAGRTRHWGVELEGILPLGDGFTLGGNCTLSRNRHIRHTVVGPDLTRLVLDGNPIAGFPDVLGSLRLTRRSEDLTASVSARAVGSFPTDNLDNPAHRVDAHTVVNLEAAYRVPGMGEIGLTLRGEVRNVLNELYFMSGEGDAFFPAAERNYLFGIALSL